MNKIIILILIFLNGCSSRKSELNYKKIYNDAISNGQCSVAQQTIPLEKDQESKMSILESSGAYVVTIGGTAITGFLDIMLMGRCQYGGCRSSEKNGIKVAFPTSYYLWSLTDNHRCPNNSYYINKLVDTVECFLKHKKGNSQKSGHLLIKHLYEKSNESFNCITIDDQERIEEVYGRSVI